MAILKTTWRHTRRSPYQAFAAIFIILQTFIVISLFTFLVFGAAKIISYAESLPQVNIFFKNEAKQEEMDALANKLQATGKVSKIKFVSKKEALAIYQQKFNDPLLLEFVTADILPASLQVSTNKIEDLSSISESIKNSAIIREFQFPRDIIENLTSWTDMLRKIGVVLIVVLGLDSVFIMMIILGIKISQRREEIEIMRLLGATSWYIRWPFLLEGIVYGIIGAVIGWSLSVAGLWYVTPQLQAFLHEVPIFPISPIFLLQLLGAEILVAILLGMFASCLAVLRYLK